LLRERKRWRVLVDRVSRNQALGLALLVVAAERVLDDDYGGGFVCDGGVCIGFFERSEKDCYHYNC
jgi:hypothetical protein